MMSRRSVDILVYLIATAVGAAPGIALAFWEKDLGLFGIAILGGLIGFGVGVSPIVYKTSLRATIRRSLGGFTRTIVDHNFGIGEQIVPMRSEASAHELIRGEKPSQEFGARLTRVSKISGTIGSIFFGVVALVLSILFLPREADEPRMKHVLATFIVAGFGGLAGAAYGSAIAMLRVPGRHRRNIIIGTTAGVFVGCSFGLAVSDAAKDPTGMWITVMVLFTSLGMGVGTFAPENFPRNTQLNA